MRADVCLSTWGDQRDGRRRDVDGRDLFEAGCSLARLACSDKVSQVRCAAACNPRCPWSLRSGTSLTIGGVLGLYAARRCSLRRCPSCARCCPVPTAP